MGRAAPTKLRGPYLPWVCLSNSSPRSFLSLWLEEGLDLQAGFRDNLKCFSCSWGVCAPPGPPSGQLTRVGRGLAAVPEGQRVWWHAHLCG